MIRIGIVGGTGYTGVELLRLLAQHPEADVRAITSRKDAGTPVAQMFPSLRGRYDLAFTDPKDADRREMRGVSVTDTPVPSRGSRGWSALPQGSSRRPTRR